MAFGKLNVGCEALALDRSNCHNAKESHLERHEVSIGQQKLNDPAGGNRTVDWGPNSLVQDDFKTLHYPAERHLPNCAYSLLRFDRGPNQAIGVVCELYTDIEGLSCHHVVLCQMMKPVAATAWMKHSFGSSGTRLCQKRQFWAHLISRTSWLGIAGRTGNVGGPQDLHAISHPSIFQTKSHRLTQRCLVDVCKEGPSLQPTTLACFRTRLRSLMLDTDLLLNRLGRPNPSIHLD